MFLKCFYVIHIDDHIDRLAGKHKKALNQRFGGLAAHEGFISAISSLYSFSEYLSRKGPRSLPRPTISALNGMLFGSIYILILHRLELSVHNVHLSIVDCENVASHISGARCLSVDLEEHAVFPSLVVIRRMPLPCIVASAMKRKPICILNL